MKSLRIEPELERRVEQAAAARGESVSEFIRRAAAERADATLAAVPASGLSECIGVVHGGGGRARRSGEAFTAALAQHVRGS